jgi:glycosyltransferase involved in cell wall biosynthesis
MSAGLPVVATRGCYMSNAATAQALVQCEQGPEALAKALSPLLLNPAVALAQGQAGQAYVHRVHDWATLASATLKIYAEGSVAS